MAGEYIPISSWAEDDKPREKMLANGVATLSTNELLAILLRSGSGGESALDLARRILADCNNDLNVLARLSVTDFMNRYKGVGWQKPHRSLLPWRSGAAGLWLLPGRADIDNQPGFVRLSGNR